MQLELAADFILNKLRQELPPSFTYHDVNHTEDVVKAAKEIALLEGVQGQDLELLLSAALFHDSGFLIQPIGHEQCSCILAQRYLVEFNYKQEEVIAICSLIRATQMPQQPENHLQQIICDADLDYLGRDDFFQKSQLLYKEMSGLGTVDSYADFMHLQLDFLEKHRYFTATSNNRCAPKKAAHLADIKTTYKS